MVSVSAPSWPSSVAVTSIGHVVDCRFAVFHTDACDHFEAAPYGLVEESCPAFLGLYHAWDSGTSFLWVVTRVASLVWAARLVLLEHSNLQEA